MPSTKVKEEKIEGHVVSFNVDETGSWYASAAVLDHGSHGKTLQEARSKITVRLRRETLKLAVKAHMVNALPIDQIEKSWYSRDDKIKSREIHPITLTGFSQRGGDIMYRFDGESGNRKRSPHQSQSDPDSVGVVCRRLNADEQKTYRKIRDTYDVARTALEEWIKAHKIENVAAFLEEQISAAVDKPDEAEPDAEDPREAAPLRDTRFDGAKKKKRK